MSNQADSTLFRPSSPDTDSAYSIMPLSKAHPLIAALLDLPRPAKQLILMGSDYFISILCFIIALSIRLGVYGITNSLLMICVYAFLPILALYAIGFYGRVTRIFFDTDMRKVLILFVALMGLFSIVYIAGIATSIPRSVPAPHLFMLFIWLWTSRILLRELLGKSRFQLLERPFKECRNVIIYGAGSSGTALYEAVQGCAEYKVVAFADDDGGLVGGRLFGKKIYPSIRIKPLIKQFSVEEVFLAMPSIGHNRRHQIINHLTDVSLKIKQLPSLQEIVEGKVTISTLRPVDILDVLNRQTVEPDHSLLQHNILAKNVLVTGAGGSIGSELCHQILKNKPKCLILYELSEYALYAVRQELLAAQAANPQPIAIKIIALIGNATNQQKLLDVFNSYQVHTVYHAAAYKHVPLVEENPFEGAINNATGTYHCLSAAITANVDTFVLISTDKAVRPTNVMGASKRLAELICQGFSATGCSTKICMVRFGNVLGSSGSVVPLFTKQIANGGPLTVTHPEVTRYFMTIPEAANLVIQAGAMAEGGEVFVLDMGDPVKIVDLAIRMIHLSGFEIKDELCPEGDIEIVFSGLRPGEKLYEELIIGDDNIETTKHPLIMQAKEQCFHLAELESLLFELHTHAACNDIAWLKQQLAYYVEGYQPKVETV